MIEHPCREGERINFIHEVDLAAALRHGYLELWLVGDSGGMNRIIRYQPETDTYLWYASMEGLQPQALNRRTYAKLEELLAEHDLHTYKWYPLFPRKEQPPSFNYHKLLNYTLPMSEDRER